MHGENVQLPDGDTIPAKLISGLPLEAVVSTQLPTGVPSDGDEWIVVDVVG